MAATRIHKQELASDVFATPSVTLGTAASGGSTGQAMQSDATIAAFDATTPATQAFGDAGTVGAAGVAARRDHKHVMPTAAVTTSGLTMATAKMLGRATASTGAIEEIAVTGSGSAVLASGPTLVAPILGTPASGVGTNLTGIPESGVTNLVTDLAAKAPLASPTFTGTVTVPTTVNATDAASKSYVDGVAQGLTVKSSVHLATVAALSPANTYSAGVLTATGVGTLTVDGVLTALNDRILVKDEAAPANNGLYLVTTAGTGGVPYVLTRTTDMDAAGEIPGAFAFVESGTVNAGSGFVVAGFGPYTLGTTAITWTQFSGTGEITAGSGLTKSGNTLDRAALTGDVTASAGSNATTLAAGSASNLNSGTLAAARMPALTGDITTSVGTVATTLANAGPGATGPIGDATHVSAVTIDAKGRVTALTSVAITGLGGLSSSNFVDNEVPSGTVNGVNAAFTLANTPTAGTQHVYKNGIRQNPGAGLDYTISTNTITFLAGNIPQTGDALLVDYRK